jgi:hypothetical protein
MKVTIQINGGYEVTVSAPDGFKLLVDDEMLLEHGGEADYNDEEEDGYETVHAKYATECGGGGAGCKCGPNVKSAYAHTDGTSSLFETIKKASEKSCLGSDVQYHTYDVANSSFIEGIRWWSEEPFIGDDALEVNLKDGRTIYYAGVPLAVFFAWVNECDTGGSAGRFYNKNIKGTYEMVTEFDGDYDGDDE